MEKYDATQLKYKGEADILADELIAAGFMATKVTKDPESRCTFNVHYFDGEHTYRITRDYQSWVYVTRDDAPQYPHVSSSTRYETIKKHRPTQKTKVITAKKIQAQIDAENAYHAEMQELENAAQKASLDFVSMLKDVQKQHGLDIKWYKDGTSGYIVRNGIELEFECGNDGYVSKKIKVHYTAENNLATFLALSDNKYKV